MVNILITFVLINLSSFIFTQEMEEQLSTHFYNFETKTINVPNNTLTFIYGDETWIQIENITIILAGNLCIQLKNDLHIRYEKLVFFETGKLTIIQEPSSHYKLTLEQISDPQSCFPEVAQGKINILSEQRYGYSEILNITNQNQIILKDSSFLNVNQQILINNFDYNTFSNLFFQVNSKEENSITINEKINIEQYSFKSSLLSKPIAIFALKSQGGIIFKKQQTYHIQYYNLFLFLFFFQEFLKIFIQFQIIFYEFEQIYFFYENSSCLQSNFENLSGVVFLNPVNLILIGYQLKNCLFLNDQTDKINYNYNRSIVIEADLQNNNFLNLEWINMQFYNNQMTNNIFYGIKNGFLILPKLVEQNYLIESNISIYSKKNEILLLDIKIHNSKISFLNDLIQIKIKNSSLFKTSVNFRLDVENLEFIQSELIELTIEFQQSLNYLKFFKCYLYKKIINSDFLSINKQSLIKNDIQIHIYDSNIKGTFSSFLNLKNCGKSCEDCNLIQENKVQIFFKDNRIDIDYFFKTQQFLHCIKAKLFQKRFNQLYEFLHIKEYNVEYPIINNLNIPEYQQTYSLVNKLPSFYRIISLDLLDCLNEQFILRINNYENAIFLPLIQQEQFQILDLIQQRLKFFSLEKYILLSKQIEFQIQNYLDSEQQPRKCQITLPISKYATLNISATLRYQMEENRIQINHQNQIFQFQSLNLTLSLLQETVWITWSPSVYDTFQIKLEFEYCLIKYYYPILNHCSHECNNQISDKICANNCIQGYYQMNQLQCQRCSEGCLKCDSNPQICEKCLPEMFLINGQCHLKCLRGYFINNKNECTKCDDYCEQCYITNSCFDCYDSFINSKTHGCSQCLNNFITENDICILCNKKCQNQKCNGITQRDCLECKPSFTYYLGECI